ncbi:hypothetical protein [Flavobacterium sp.]|uniref:hypothetical protein n=1 Tax=Flavobacterium sp. TaxID=239 RepID=UPI0039E28D96
MNHSVNIKVEKDFSSFVNPELQQQKLEIGTKNLDDYNSRLGLNIELNYNSDDYEFKVIDKFSSKAFSICSSINSYTFWALQHNKDTATWIEPFLFRISNIANNIKQEYYASIMLSSKPDVEGFIFKKNEFVKTYQNFCPLGFLSNESCEYIKAKLNNLCNDLNAIA